MTHNPWTAKRAGQALEAPPHAGGSAGAVRIIAWQPGLVTQLTSVLAGSKGTHLIQHLCAGGSAQKLLSKQGIVQMFQVTHRETEPTRDSGEHTGFESQACLFPSVGGWQVT